MLGWRSSGLSPTPSAGAGSQGWNGFGEEDQQRGEEAAKPSSTAVA